MALRLKVHNCNKLSSKFHVNLKMGPVLAVLPSDEWNLFPDLDLGGFPE
jgi:hypothetical protein